MGTKNRRNYTIGERSIIILGILSGHQLEEINEVLKKEQQKTKNSIRELNPRSYTLVKSVYAPSMFEESDIEAYRESFDNVWNYIQNPKQMTDIKND